MWQDPIVEEVHAIREQLLAQFNGDLHRYCAYVQSHALPTAGVAVTVPPQSPPATSSPETGAQQH